MTDILNQTLAQIVTDNHKAATVFEKYHLDFCCKGKRPLAQACTEKNLPADKIIQELNEVIGTAATGEAPIINYISLTQLCDYIVATHHAYVQQNTLPLFFYLEKIADKHGDRHPELKEIFQLFAQLKEELTEHMFKEEKILFPRIKEIEKHINNPGIPGLAYIKIPIAILEHEHDSAGDLLERIRQKTDNYTPPKDACTTYRVAFASLQAFEADLHQHVHLENNILFPGAIKLLGKLTSNPSN